MKAAAPEAGTSAERTEDGLRLMAKAGLQLGIIDHRHRTRASPIRKAALAHIEDAGHYSGTCAQNRGGAASSCSIAPVIPGTVRAS
jgi:hypothetical protein